MKAVFISDGLHTSRPIGAKRFHLSKPLMFYSGILNKHIVVPVGFKTDFASIPWFLQSLIQVNGPHIHAAVVHDYLCVHGKDVEISQQDADLVFLEAMKVLGVRPTQRRAMYRGVRLYQSTKGFIKGLFK